MNYILAAEQATANRKETERLSEEWWSLTKEVEKHLSQAFEKAWKKKFSSLHCYAISTFLRLDEEDQSAVTFGVYLYNIGHNRDIKFLPGGGFGVQDPDDEYDYLIPTDKSPISWDDLMAFITQFETDNPGAKIVLAEGKVRDFVDPDEGVRNLKELQLLHPKQEVKLVSKHKKWYQGWDIPDHAIIVTIDGIKWAWWSNDAHGGAMDQKASEGTPEWENFIEYWLNDSEPEF